MFRALFDGSTPLGKFYRPRMEFKPDAIRLSILGVMVEECVARRRYTSKYKTHEGGDGRVRDELTLFPIAEFQGVPSQAGEDSECILGHR